MNEDSILARSAGDHLVFGIADGLGGHARGEVASSIAIAELDRIDGDALSSSDPEFLLLQVFAEANMQIVLYNREHGVNSGTTLTACIVSPGGRCTIGNLGDSRAYVIDEKTCWHTKDHSYVQQLIDLGELSERTAIRHPQSNIITRALGLERGCVPDISEVSADGKLIKHRRGVVRQTAGRNSVFYIRAQMEPADFERSQAFWAIGLLPFCKLVCNSARDADCSIRI